MQLFGEMYLKIFCFKIVLQSSLTGHPLGNFLAYVQINRYICAFERKKRSGSAT